MQLFRIKKNTFTIIHTTEAATITIMDVKYVLIIGICDEGGCMSLTTCMKNVRAIKMVISRLTFSPASGG